MFGCVVELQLLSGSKNVGFMYSFTKIKFKKLFIPIISIAISYIVNKVLRFILITNKYKMCDVVSYSI
jgi:hypothetical protein